MALLDPKAALAKRTVVEPLTTIDTNDPPKIETVLRGAERGFDVPERLSFDSATACALRAAALIYGGTLPFSRTARAWAVPVGAPT
jgi:hypothetical protein